MSIDWVKILQFFSVYLLKTDQAQLKIQTTIFLKRNKARKNTQIF